MAKRSKDWSEGLAKDLQNAQFACEFILAALEEGVALQLALGKVIRAMGVKEFSKKIKMAPPNVLRVIDPRHNPTHETLNRILKPFGLVLTVVPVQDLKKRAA